MTIRNRNDPRLHCYTAKYKLTEARYFLNKFKTNQFGIMTKVLIFI
ncbi:MAG: hypothetical protein IIB80_04160 [Thaumarchaeota archaeon]|nr:hypothetical protein [Nitrososphaerota archaeon]